MTKQIAAIYNRRSTRSFLDKEIPEQILYDMIQSGTYAPSSGNMQPWEFIVVTDKQKKEEAVAATFSGYYSASAPHQQWILTAPVILIICANIKRTASRYASLSEKWVAIDIANAVQNIILTAAENEIATCWVGGIKEETISQSFHLPDYIQPMGLLPMGYAKEKTIAKYKMGPEWVTHNNRYNQPFFHKKYMQKT